MKIKYALMLSYFVVMVLPILALYLLYVSLSHYNHHENVRESLEFQKIALKLEPILQEPSLYSLQHKETYKQLDALTDESLQVRLFLSDGWQTYDSNNVSSNLGKKIEKEFLFQNLYETKERARSYQIKQPVFQNGKLIGVYEITKGRKQWVETFQTRFVLMLIGAGIFFMVFYLFILWFLNRKFIRPLKKLQTHMNAFAAGEETTTSIGRTKDEIGELVGHFEQMKAQISESRAALQAEQREKELMIASLSHDLKTPLTVIQTYSEALETNNQLTAAERMEYRNILFKKLTHMKQMIEDLAIYTALQSSQNKMELVYVNGKEFFDMLVAGYEAPCKEKQIKLLLALAVENGYMLEPKQMIRVADNIVDNSIRYTPVGGRIGIGVISSRNPLPAWIFPEYVQDLEVFRENGTVLLVQNDGETIPHDKLQYIFRPFYQVDASRSNNASSGLGLSISKILMEKQGGSIDIWSVPGRGTCIACLIKERRYEV